MILEPGADDLLAVIEILGADEANDGVDEQRPILACNRIGAGFERLLVDAVVRVGRKRAPCPVSKYMALLPTVPRCRLCAAS